MVDYESGMTLGSRGGSAEFDLDVAAPGNSEVMRAKLDVMQKLGLRGETIEDILITLGSQYHLIRPIQGAPDDKLFLYLVLNKAQANLAMARRDLKVIEQEFFLAHPTAGRAAPRQPGVLPVHRRPALSDVVGLDGLQDGSWTPPARGERPGRRDRRRARAAASDARITAAALVDVDSGMVLDAWSAHGPGTGPAAPDLEMLGAQHAEVVRCALALLAAHPLPDGPESRRLRGRPRGRRRSSAPAAHRARPPRRPARAGRRRRRAAAGA